MFKHKMTATVSFEISMVGDVEKELSAEKKFCKEVEHIEQQLKNSLYLLADCVQVDVTEIERERETI